MKLSAEGKKSLIDSANKVYLAYTALNFFKGKKFPTPAGENSLYELCKKAVAENKLDQTLLINGVNYRLVLTPGANNTYKVQFARPVSAITKPPVKKIGAYSESEALTLLASQEFSLEVPGPDAEPVVSNRINKDYVIGGKGKVDLYSTHLVTLHNIIEKITNEDDISNLLVALATGSGKTFVQALWMFILSLSNNNGVFAVPDKLANQFAKDLKRILPDSFVDTVNILREKEPNPQVEGLVKALAKKETAGKIIVGSSERLLDQHYQELMDANSERTFLAFDEQHLIMKEERRRIRLIELSKQKLSMFLTATPNKETYDLSGNRPVAIMSSGQKQQAGQGQFPDLITHDAKNISDRNKLKDYKFWTLEFWQNIFYGFLLRLTNSIQKEHSSSAVSLVEELPFYVQEKEGEKNVRWRVQVPAARKMLCIIDDNETLVNFCNALQHAGAKNRDVYHQGNVVNRSDVAGFFNIPDADESIVEQYMGDKRREHSAALAAKGIDSTFEHDTSLKGRLKSNIFHNLVEYVLTDITGLDEIEHNRLRKKDMNAFVELVLKKYQLRTAEYYQEKLGREIDPEGAKIIGGLLADLSAVLNEMKGLDAKSAHEFIDNWSLNDSLFWKCTNTDIASDRYFNHKFTGYADKHLMIGVMSGMKDSETPVAESRPFAGLSKKDDLLYDENGTLKADAKKRKHTSLEVLSNTSRESTFTPDYLSFPEEMADTYFRLGFVGMYVSNKKAEGFSDRNLHTVLNLSEHSLSKTNSPDTQIQIIGRNRGLDDTVKPTYIHSLGRHQQSTFDLRHLQSDDYYPELFKAQATYNKKYVKALGEHVSQQIIAWVHANLDKDETINPDRLKRQVLKFIAIALRDINNKNNHQIKLSRAQLTKIVGYAMAGLDKEIAHINSPYSLSYFLRGLGAVLNFLSECYYTVKRIPVAVQVYYHSWFGKREPIQGSTGQKHPDDVYIKIIHKTSFKSIISKMSSMLEFNNWLGRKAEGIEAHVRKNIGNYLKKDAVDVYTKHQSEFLVPLLMKLVVDSKQEKVANAIASFPQFMSLLQSNLPLLKNLFDNKSANFEKEALGFLQQIPGLQDLNSADIVNYPKNMAAIQSVFADKPIKILTAYPELKAALSSQLTAFLKNDFSKYLSAFVTYPQVKEFKKILNKDNKSQEFVDHCMKKLISGELEFSPELFLTELKSFFPSNKLTTLTENMKQLLTNFRALQEEIQKMPFGHLNDDALAQLIPVLRDQLLPALVNLYPLEYRKKLLLNATDEKIKALLDAHSSELLSISEKGEVEFTKFIFSKLQKDPLPAPINPEEEVEKAKRFFISEFGWIKGKATVVTGFKRVVSFITRSTPAEYSFDEPIANVLQKDTFFDAIASLLPYNKWLDFKNKVKQDKGACLNVAKKIVALGDEAVNLSPDQLIGLFNEALQTNYETTPQVAEKAGQSIKSNIEEISANLLRHLSVGMQNKFVALGNEQLLPLLASFIKEDSKKEQFLAALPSHKVMYQFITENAHKLPDLLGAKEDTLKANALGLVNQLLPDGLKLDVNDIVDPEEHAVTTAKVMADEVQRTTLVTFLSSSTFRDLMKNLLNHQDFQLLMTCMSSEQQIKALADAILAKEGVSLDKDGILDIIKSSNPKLKDIETLDKRLTNFQSFIDEIEKNKEKNLDKNKMAQIVADSMAPVLFHTKFISTVDSLIGFLDEQDLTVIFESFKKEKPAEEAKQFINFLKLIRAQDKAGLISQFMTIPETVEDFDYEQLPAKKMIKNLADLIGEVLDCHCHYNQQGRTGDPGRADKPRLIDKMSRELSEMNIFGDHSFFNGFSRKMFYIQGIRKGIDAAGEVSADSNHHMVKILQRVKAHILRPLWWSTNVSKLTHSFIKGCRDMGHSVTAGYFGMLNGIKSALNWISGSTYFNVSAKNPDSHDYQETAHEFAEKINELDPLVAEQVKEAACPTDVVVHLEKYVEARASRAGFFGNLGVTPDDDLDSVSKNMEDDRAHSSTPE